MGKFYPLSSGQLGLWFLEQMAAGRPAYHVPVVFGISGDLNSELLAEAVTAVSRRHDGLAARFTTFDGEPVQMLDPEQELRCIREDLSERQAVAGWGAVTERIGEIVRTPFNLRSDPLLRVHLLRTGIGVAAESGDGIPEHVLVAVGAAKPFRGLRHLAAEADG